MLEQIGLRFAMALSGTARVRDVTARDEGQTLVEYALILVTVAIGVIASMTFLRERIAGLFSQIGSPLLSP